MGEVINLHDRPVRGRTQPTAAQRLVNLLATGTASVDVAQCVYILWHRAVFGNGNDWT